MRKTLLVTVVLVTTASVSAQSAFDAASIKRTAEGNGTSFLRTSSGLTVTGAPFRALLEMAFQTRQIDLSRVADSLSSRRFDIAARTSNKIAGDQHWEMLRALLEDRFKLRYHRENKEGPVYALTRANTGPDAGSSLVNSVDADCPDNPTRSNFCGIMMVTGLMTGQRVSLTQLAMDLALYARLPVQNESGRKGLFDFQLKWTPDPYDDKVPLLNGVPINVLGTTFRAGMREQLGLQLESKQGGIETVVIDYAEEPAEN
jgi:uncharacterized protein (TIGR03435 family)